MPVSRKNPKRGKNNPTSQCSREKQRENKSKKDRERRQHEMDNWFEAMNKKMGL